MKPLVRPFLLAEQWTVGLEHLPAPSQPELLKDFVAILSFFRPPAPQTNDLTSVHLGVKFSCRFNLREIQERWYALLYDPVISK